MDSCLRFGARSTWLRAELVGSRMLSPRTTLTGRRLNTDDLGMSETGHVPGGRGWPPLMNEIGRPFLASVCGLDETEFATAEQQRDFTSEQLEVLQMVGALLVSGGHQMGQTGMPPRMMVAAAIERVPDFHPSRLRESCGKGPLSVPDTDDVGSALGAYANELLPYLLLEGGATRRDPMGSEPLTSQANRNNQHRRDFERLLLEDPVLARLFPESEVSDLSDEHSRLNIMSYVTTSLEVGGSVQLVRLAENITRSAYTVWRMRGSPRTDGFAELVVDQLDVVRRACAGESVPAPVFVGINNVAIPTEVSLAQGRAFPFSEQAGELVPPEAAPSSSSAVDGRLGLVLEIPAPFTIKVSSAAAAERTGEWATPNGTQWPTSPVDLRELAESVSLAITLAVEREPPVAAQIAWTVPANPLFSGSSSWSRERTPSEPHVLTESETVSMVEWSRRVLETDSSALAIAKHRLLSALNQRRDPADGFIDAIVALENLFGADTELSFRVAACTARLLCADYEERLATFKKVKGMYSRRSKLIHGSTLPNHEGDSEDWKASTLVVVGVLRVLWTEWPELLQSNSADRSQSILLG